MKKYLGYALVTPGINSESHGGYSDYMLCEGKSPAEVVVDYFTKLGKLDEYKPEGVIINADETLMYHECFATDYIYFIELPGENVYMPDLLNIVKSDDPIKFRVGDHVYFTETEQELKCHGCAFEHLCCDIAGKTSIPIEGKIVAIIMTEDGVLYQIDGCERHFENKDIGKFVFITYEDAMSAINAEKRG